MVCATPVTGQAFLGGVLDYIDCQAQTIGSAGYQALASSGSPVAAMLTSLLTIFIALIGVRMLLGQSFEIRDGVLAAVKIGIVLVLATSWPAVRTLLYDVVFRGPAEIATTTAGSSALIGDGLTGRLQRVDDAIVALTNLGTGRNELPPIVGGVPSPTIADDLAFGLGRTAYLASTIGATALVRLSAGLLLALGPIFAGLLLFGATRSVFSGWLRGLGAAALGGLALALLLAIELALLEPWLADALARRAVRQAALSAPIELLVLTLGFAAALFGLLALVARIAFTVHIEVPQWGRSADSPAAEEAPRLTATPPNRIEFSGQGANPRALLVADAVAAVQRREEARQLSDGRPGDQAVVDGAGSRAASASAGINRGPGRRTRTRVSQSARNRDLRQ